ncbi:choice-of-anchor L domain-containing protein [bacterium]|nr:choice-of-anchor L domain-containing protein [bacterium]
MRYLSLLFFVLVFFTVGCSQEEGGPLLSDDSDQLSGDTGGDNGDSSADSADSGDSSDSGNSSADSADSGDSCDSSSDTGDSCTPGETAECYTGPAGTKDNLPCKAGVVTCVSDGSGWGVCKGEVLPVFEICDNGIDEDCDGSDRTASGTEGDVDGDGYTVCEGDCCETVADCPHPELVNPGAAELLGNGIDDNCDGRKDELPICGDGTLGGDAALSMAQAMDLCAETTETGKGWGVISAELLYPDGKKTDNKGEPVQTTSYNIFDKFGAKNSPMVGADMAAIGTGVVVSPYINYFNNDFHTESNAPADWHSANGNTFPSAPSCGNTQDGKNPVMDAIMLKLKIRVPVNAISFSMGINFFSYEFPSWVCSEYNDMFLVLLDSSYTSTEITLQNPVDKNLAMDELKNPVGVNLAKSGLFKVCDPSTGFASCVSADALAGTGMYAADPLPSPLPYDGYVNSTHGATGWLFTHGNVVPGEVIELRVVIWDTDDSHWQSLSLLDNFQWHDKPFKPGTSADQM